MYIAESRVQYESIPLCSAWGYMQRTFQVWEIPEFGTSELNMLSAATELKCY